MQIKSFQNNEQEKQRQEKGELVGAFAEMAKPYLDLKQKVAAFKKLNKAN